MVRRIVEEAGLVDIWSHGEAINLPGTNAALNFESVKTESDIWALPHIDQATRAVFHFLSSGTNLDPAPIISGSNFKKCGLEVQLFLINRPRAADPLRIQAAF